MDGWLVVIDGLMADSCWLISFRCFLIANDSMEMSMNDIDAQIGIQSISLPSCRDISVDR